MKKFFSLRENKYNLRTKIGTLQYGLETALYCVLQLWFLVLSDIKSLLNVNLFKYKHLKSTVPHENSVRFSSKTKPMFNISTSSIKA